MSDNLILIEKALEIINELIQNEEVRLSEIKSSMSATQWRENRLGLTKKLYNLYEERQIFTLKSYYPDELFYSQAKYTAYELPNGKIIPIEEPRIVDIFQESEGFGQAYELKTGNAIAKSVKGGLKPKQQLEFDFKDSSYLKRQINKEKSIISEAAKLKAKILITCKNPINGTSVLIKMEPSKIGISRVMKYGTIPDKVLRGGFFLSTTSRNLSYNSQGYNKNTFPKPNFSKSTTLLEELRVNARGTATGKPQLEQRATSRVSSLKLLNRGLGTINTVTGFLSMYSLADEIKNLHKRRVEIPIEGKNASDYPVGTTFTDVHLGKDEFGQDMTATVRVETDVIGKRRFYVVMIYGPTA